MILGKWNNDRTLFSRTLETMAFYREIIWNHPQDYGPTIQVSELLLFTQNMVLHEDHGKVHGNLTGPMFSAERRLAKNMVDSLWIMAIGSEFMEFMVLK